MNEERSIPLDARKYHDVWAVILYIIALISCGAFVIMKKPEFNTSLFDNYKWEIFKTFLQNLGFVTGYSFTIVLLLAYCSKAVLIITYIIPMIFSLLFAIVFPMGLTIGNLIFQALATLACLYFTWSYMTIGCFVIGEACKIILTYLFTVILSFLVMQIIFLAICAMLVAFSGFLDSSNNIGTYFTTCMFFWNSSMTSYFFCVLVGALVYLHICKETEEDKEVSVRSSAVSVAMYALGTICFASLILAIIHTMQYIVNHETQKKREESERRKGEPTQSALNYILLIVCSVLLWLLEKYISIANDFVMPCIVVKGTNFYDSMKIAHRRVFEHPGLNMAIYIFPGKCLNWLLFLSFIFLAVANFFIKHWAGWTIENNLYFSIPASIISWIFLYQMFNFVGDASLTMLYMFFENRDMLRRYNPKLVDVIINK